MDWVYILYIILKYTTRAFIWYIYLLQTREIWYNNNNNNNHNKIESQLLLNRFWPFKDRSKALDELIWYRSLGLCYNLHVLRIPNHPVSLKSGAWLLSYCILKTGITFGIYILDYRWKPNTYNIRESSSLYSKRVLF